MQLSIIVPVYNTPPEKLMRCFKSIRQLSGISYEVIIIDDGSADSVGDFCKAYSEKHAFFQYYFQENQGVSAARNAGIAYASGEYIMFVDADDALVSESVLPEHVSGDWDIVFYDYWLCEDNRKETITIFDAASETEWKKKDYIIAACSNRINSVWSRLFRRNLITENQIRFDETMVVAEDAKFMLQTVVAANKMLYVPVAAYCYYHSFNDGDKRLARYPVKVQENVIALYKLRLAVLESCVDQLDFNEEDLCHLHTTVRERLVRDLFEARGSLLIMGIDHEEMSRSVCDILMRIEAKYVCGFSMITEAKYWLLKSNLDWLIKRYAWMRKKWYAKCCGQSIKGSNDEK